MITSCRNAHIAVIQCRYKDLVDIFLKKAQIGSTDIECYLSKMKVVSKYISMMYCYKTLTTDLFYAYKFDLLEIEYDDVILIQAAIDALGIYSTSYDTATSYLYVYSYNVGAVHQDILNAIATVTTETITAINVVATPDFLLDLWNCITYTEFCSIINHAYCLTTI
jgi:hypothetical protein